MPRRYYQTVDVPLLHGSQRLGEGAINLSSAPQGFSLFTELKSSPDVMSGMVSLPLTSVTQTTATLN